MNEEVDEHINVAEKEDIQCHFKGKKKFGRQTKGLKEKENNRRNYYTKQDTNQQTRQTKTIQTSSHKYNYPHNYKHW